MVPMAEFDIAAESCALIMRPFTDGGVAASFIELKFSGVFADLVNQQWRLDRPTAPPGHMIRPDAIKKQTPIRMAGPETAERARAPFPRTNGVEPAPR
jgi:hypothetical protein